MRSKWSEDEDDTVKISTDTVKVSIDNDKAVKSVPKVENQDFPYPNAVDSKDGNFYVTCF